MSNTDAEKPDDGLKISLNQAAIFYGKLASSRATNSENFDFFSSTKEPLKITAFYPI